MNAKILKLKFTSGVHFGDGGLEKIKNTLRADTVFSALCMEAVRQNKLEALVNVFEEGKLRISDTFPFIGETLYLPKPMMRIITKNQGDSTLKKAMKSLKYIPLEKFEQFLEGSLDVAKEDEHFHRSFGKSVLTQKAAILEEEDNLLYSVGSFHYHKGSGLYMIAVYEDEEDFMLLSDLMDSISFSGIGGKISSGYGRFELSVMKVPDILHKKIFSDTAGAYMTLCISLPDEDELESALEEAQYSVVKRSGFVASMQYSNTFQKKRDLYMLESGGTFKNKFKGRLFDVSDGGNHKVFRYGFPLFLEVR